MADEAERPPQAVIHPGQVCTDPDGRPSASMAFHGVRTWGNSPDGSTLLAVGTYQLHSEVSRRLLAALPPLLLVRREEWNTPLVTLLAEEIRSSEPGQEAVLDRLLDLVLISALRIWAARPQAGASRPGTARRPTRSSVRSSGSCTSIRSGRGRSTPSPARPGCPAPPWRATSGTSSRDADGLPHARSHARAADLLREPGATVAAVANQVGYGSGYALSTAFRGSGV